MIPELPEPQRIKNILSKIHMNEIELEEAVVHLREWLKKQPHLPKSADDITLKSFIIGCKSLERAKYKLDSYYTYRVLYSSPFFLDRDPCKFNWVKGQKLCILPGLTPDDCKIILVALPSPEGVPDFDVGTCFKMVIMSYDMLIRRYYMTSGVYVIFDMYNLSKELVLKASLTLCQQYAKIFQESYPIRIKAFVGFNAPPLAEMFMNTFLKPFFSQKLKERMSLQSSDHKCLEKYIPLEMLPSDYGGNSESSDVLNVADKAVLDSMQDWFLKEGSEKSMEDFRPKRDNDDMKGTYRKIQVE